LPSRTENKQSERPAYPPIDNGMLQQMFPKFAISCRVDSSLWRGCAAQGGDNSEQFPRVRPRSRRAIIFHGELRQNFGIDIIAAERRHVPFEIEISQQAAMFTPISGLSPRLKHILPNFGVARANRLAARDGRFVRGHQSSIMTRSGCLLTRRRRLQKERSTQLQGRWYRAGGRGLILRCIRRWCCGGR
jgi:hypothetical protein